MPNRLAIIDWMLGRLEADLAARLAQRSEDVDDVEPPAQWSRWCYVCIGVGTPFTDDWHCVRCGAHTPWGPSNDVMITCPNCGDVHHSSERPNPYDGLRWGTRLGTCPACGWGSMPEVAERDRLFMTESAWEKCWAKSLADPYAPWNKQEES